MRRVVFQNEQFQWIDLSHPTPEELKTAQAEFHLHPLFVQDCLDPIHLPKFESLGTNTFLIVRLFDQESGDDADTVQSMTRKIALFVGSQRLVTAHRLDDDQFNRLVEVTLANGATSLPALVARLINQALRSFNTPLNRAEERLLELENQLFDCETNRGFFRDVHLHRRRLSLVKRILIHTQDTVQELSPAGDTDSPLFQDLRENVAGILFWADELLEDATNLMNLQINLSAQKTNEVIRVLTIFSVFLMPPTFIVGIYGMNFKNFPELEWEHGYAAVWGLMILVTIVIAIWFKRRGWLSSSN